MTQHTSYTCDQCGEKTTNHRRVTLCFVTEPDGFAEPGNFELGIDDIPSEYIEQVWPLQHLCSGCYRERRGAISRALTRFVQGTAARVSIAMFEAFRKRVVIGDDDHD